MNDAGRRVRQHFADTDGFTDHVFAACALLGYRFAPRIRDLPQKRLDAFTPNATPPMCERWSAARSMNRSSSQLARHPARHGDDRSGDRRPQPDSSQTRLLPAPE
jgi:hypothetical protein